MIGLSLKVINLYFKYIYNHQYSLTFRNLLLVESFK